MIDAICKVLGLGQGLDPLTKIKFTSTRWGLEVATDTFNTWAPGLHLDDWFVAFENSVEGTWPKGVPPTSKQVM